MAYEGQSLLEIAIAVERRAEILLGMIETGCPPIMVQRSIAMVQEAAAALPYNIELDVCRPGPDELQ